MLRILSLEEAWTEAGDLCSRAFLDDMQDDLLEHTCSYALPERAEQRTCLARALVEIATNLSASGFLWITSWGVAEQNMNLFDGYRRSFGEHRPLIEAPIHAFSKEDRVPLECLLDLILYFSWDCYIFDRSFKYLIKLSHDEYIDIAGEDEATLDLIAAEIGPLQLQDLFEDSEAESGGETESKAPELTEGQLRSIPRFVETWVSIALNTQPADRARAERGVRQCYRAAGLAEPDVFLWFDSPAAGSLASASLMSADESQGSVLGPYAGSAMWHLRDAASHDLMQQADESAYRKISTELAGVVARRVDNLRAAISDRIVAELTAGIEPVQQRHLLEYLESRLPANTRLAFAAEVAREISPDRAEEVVREALPGQEMSDWLSIFSFFSRVCGIHAGKKLSGWQEIAESCGWWWPFEKGCVMVERPSELHFDDEFALHNAAGPAVRYPDDWSIYAWHGCVIPKTIVVEPQAITPSQILEERQVEIRSATVALYGEDRLTKGTGIKVLDVAQYREAARQDRPHPSKSAEVLVRFKNSRSREIYLLRVPAE